MPRRQLESANHPARVAEPVGYAVRTNSSGSDVPATDGTHSVPYRTALGHRGVGYSLLRRTPNAGPKSSLVSVNSTSNRLPSAVNRNVTSAV